MSDSGLVKSCFILRAWSSASSRPVKVEDGADWGPRERSNFSSLLPVTYPKWESAIHGETEEGEKVRHSQVELCN